MLCLALSFVLQVYFHVIHVSSQGKTFADLDGKMFAFLWYVLFESYPKFERNNVFLQQPDFQKGCTILKICYLEFQTDHCIIKIVSGISPVQISFIAVVSKMYITQMLRYQSDFIIVL
jgi:hypothetical protein